VVILDSVKNLDMPAVYALAEFAVLASQFDQWGLCISEAFAAKCPAIVTWTCGVAGELVADGIDGFIVEPGDVHILAERMVVLGSDVALRGRFAEKARSTTDDWTPAPVRFQPYRSVDINRNAREKHPQPERASPLSNVSFAVLDRPT
jgi:glycosyltransferase involved in cell wall biosynthesis